MNESDIQRLLPGDWMRFRTIRLRALADSPDAFGSTLERELQFEDADWQDRAARRDAATFVATSAEGHDVGLAVGAPYDEVAGLYSMWVSPEARGRGLGGALVDAAVNWAIQAGYARIFLDVGDDNSPAIALYESKGFVPTGVTGTLPPPRESIREHQRERLVNSTGC